jgi:erythromycin esterase-like protein
MSDKELPARLAIESQYARLSEAVRNKDWDALRALHTSEYRELQKLDKPRSEIPTGEKTRLIDGASKALDLIEAQREMLVMASTPEEYCDLRQAARIVLQALEMRAGILERDRAMAENVCWLIEEGFPGQKIVLWAHNGHIGTDMGSSEKSMGSHLRGRYGDQMVVIGSLHTAAIQRFSWECGDKPPLRAQPYSSHR